MSHLIGMKPSEKEIDSLRQRQGELSRQIRASWKRSAAAGVNRGAKALPEVSQFQKDLALHDVPTGARYKRQLLQGYLSDLENSLVAWGGAVVYLNHSLRIFGHIGEPDFLDQLKAKHLEVGASLAEDIAGTNAASLTRSLLSGCRIDPGDNYCTLFDDYVSFTQGPMRIGLDDFIVMLVLFPKELVSTQLAQAVESALYAEGVISEFSTTLDANASLAMFDIMMEGQGFSYLIIDEYESVVNISRRLLDVLNLRGGTTIGASARDLFPELSPVFDACKHLTDTNTQTKIDGLTLNGSPTWAIASSLPNGESALTGIALRTDSLDAVGTTRRGVSIDEAFAGNSPAMARAKETIQKVAIRENDVLIIGERGTGKSSAARVLHALSPRRNAAFVSCNCALIPDAQIDALLFGAKGEPGLFEQARNGTLFFDGIEELSPKAQAVLADVMDARSDTFGPGRIAWPTDARLVFSSGFNTFELADRGVLSPSLAYRLPPLVVTMPPLRDCADDIPLIAHRILSRLQDGSARNAHAPLPSPASLAKLATCSWPHNALELKSALDWAYERATADGLALDSMVDEIIRAKAKPQDRRAQTARNTRTKVPAADVPSHELRYDDIERNELIDALRRHHGNKSAVAKELEVARTTLYAKMRKYGLM